ncbi:MAG TPA: DUF4349 domain-containing protein [Actinomycetota bacterium]|nr:DUF4349 domain-containing protein [Actinomycetota bacterium]
MDVRRMAVALVAVAAIAGACGGDDEDSAAVSVQEPIGAPEDDLTAGPGTPAAVVKSASIEMEVPRDGLGSAAQQVVDIATSPRIGGYLVSSIVDTDGYGAGKVLVKVPSGSFEEAVGQLERVGDVTRQQLEGADVSPEAAAARGRVERARRRAAALLQRIEEADDATVRRDVRDELVRVREELGEARREAASVDAGAAFSSIDVALEGEPPPPPPEKSTLERALDTAASVSAGIASGIVLAAAVVLPIALLLLVLLLVGPRVVRLVKPRLRT